MKDHVLISVIICSYNREQYIIAALNSLLCQNFPPSDFEIIVVDNNSKDKTEEKCRDYIVQHPNFNIIYLNEQKQGSSFARNTGASIARGKLIVFMDDDAKAHSGYLKEAWDFYSSNPSIKGFGGKIIPLFIPDEPKWMSPLLASLVGRFDYGTDLKAFKEGKYPLESNMAVETEAFKFIHGFNTSLPGVKGTLRIGGEGKDLFYRLSQAFGEIYYVPNMMVDHIVEVNKLTSEYMYRVASGIGRGERIRIGSGTYNFITKLIEYVYKLAGAFIIALYYIVSIKPLKAFPLIKFRIDVLKGFLGK